MKRPISTFARAVFLAMVLAVAGFGGQARAEGTAIVVDLEGALGVATAEFIIDGDALGTNRLVTLLTVGLICGIQGAPSYTLY